MVVKKVTTFFKYRLIMCFSDNLREKWELSDLGQKELAYIADIKIRSLESYIRGTNASIPSADKAVRLAQALGTTVEYLVTGKDAHGKAAPPPPLSPELRHLERALAPLTEVKRKIVLKNAVGLAELMK
jgi:transcriptional regulator with XRE-family HTH domain